jgi:hypothetical protein
MLATRARLVAKVSPKTSSPVTAVFDLAGAEDVIKEVRSACGQ